MEVADLALKPVREFAKDSIRLVNKCTKPDRKEFSKIALRTGLGFIVMGFVGFFVKLILCAPEGPGGAD
jgi:protein transport protein SEC61 subunit gamma-like protein